jgi:hypothetical protein
MESIYAILSPNSTCRAAQSQALIAACRVNGQKKTCKTSLQVQQ